MHALSQSRSVHIKPTFLTDSLPNREWTFTEMNILHHYIILKLKSPLSLETLNLILMKVLYNIIYAKIKKEKFTKIKRLSVEFIEFFIQGD